MGIGIGNSDVGIAEGSPSSLTMVPAGSSLARPGRANLVR